jgi:hypothetical protein
MIDWIEFKLGEDETLRCDLCSNGIMGERYLKAEEEAIRELYPTATRFEILSRIPDRTWGEIGVKARKMGIHRTKEAKGESVREGRKKLKHSWSDAANERFDLVYPNLTRAHLLNAFSSRTWLSIVSHAQKRHLHRTREAVGREISIGREEARKK